MIKLIDVSKISPHPDNPRQDLGDLTELTESIKANGILQNLTVVPWFSKITGVGADDPRVQEEMGYIVVIGHRRLAAAKLAGLEEVPCSIADMDQRTQIATMLTENIQRSDLTIYEQAQGFQMMLNFGDTVNDIAERTGFSETTVRRRVKLLDLDGEKFKKSVERGATLLDYAELDKIKDSELKNSVLDKIGTPNFRYALERAVDEEKSAENKAKLLAQLEQFATQTDNSSGMRYVTGYYPSRDNKVTIPEDADTTEHFYVVSDYGSITLYTKHVQSKTGVDAAETERRNKQQERQAALDEITKRAYRLRLDFVKNYSGAKKHVRDLMEFAVRVMLHDFAGIDYEVLEDILGIEADDEDPFEFKNIAEQFNVLPEHVFLLTIYCALDSERQVYYHSWNLSHYENETLDMIYDFLERLGYEMSDEERALQDGTHELYFRDEEK